MLWEFTAREHGPHLRQPGDHQAGQRHLGGRPQLGLNNADGVGRLYLMNAATGALVVDPVHRHRTAADPSGLAKINAWVDDHTNNTAKRFYGGDMLGNLWRFDFNSPLLYRGRGHQAGAVPAQQHVAAADHDQAAVDGGHGQRRHKVPVIVVATGRYLGTTDVSDTTVQSIYAIKDRLTATGWGDVRTQPTWSRKR